MTLTRTEAVEGVGGGETPAEWVRRVRVGDRRLQVQKPLTMSSAAKESKEMGLQPEGELGIREFFDGRNNSRFTC